MNPAGHQDEDLKKAERIAYLVAAYLQGRLTPAEQDELDEWITESDDNLELFENLTSEENIDAAMEKYRAIEAGKSGAYEKLKQKLAEEARQARHRRIWPWLIAASLLLLAGLAWRFWLGGEQSTPPPMAKRTTTTDKSPAEGKAVLTLSSGRTVILDSATAGGLGTEGGVAIQSGAGQLTYNGTAKEMRYNTVATPRGGQYAITLADGTKVWLNADSWLKFPAGFATAERVVELKGEAYFEVTKDPDRPFRVKLDGEGDSSFVQVLGTTFNVNAYGDEGAAIVTLAEGSVRVQQGTRQAILKPGQQAVLANNITVSPADVEEETAWKHGLFLFRNASILVIAAQIRRWYDIEVVQVGHNNQQFNLEVARNIPLSRLLKALEKTGQVHFRLEEKKLVIQP